MSLPLGSEIKPSGYIKSEDFDMLARGCQEFNFAVVRRGFSHPLLRAVAEETIGITQSADMGRGWRDDSGKAGILVRDVYTGGVDERFPGIDSVMSSLVQGLGAAALNLGLDRVNLGKRITCDVLMANTYPRGGSINRHFDFNPGVVFVHNTHGVGRVELSDSDRNVLGVTDLTPGDTLILPAQVGERGGAEDQAWHEVDNVTPYFMGGGVRRSVVATFKSA